MKLNLKLNIVATATNIYLASANVEHRLKVRDRVMMRALNEMPKNGCERMRKLYL